MTTSLSALSEHDWNVLRSSWHRFGAAHFVTRLKSGRWLIADRLGRGWPVFTTKREAMAAVDRLLRIESRVRAHLPESLIFADL